MDDNCEYVYLGAPSADTLNAISSALDPVAVQSFYIASEEQLVNIGYEPHYARRLAALPSAMVHYLMLMASNFRRSSHPQLKDSFAPAPWSWPPSDSGDFPRPQHLQQIHNEEIDRLQQFERAVKTSISHPINITGVVPPNYLHTLQVSPVLDSSAAHATFAFDSEEPHKLPSPSSWPQPVSYNPFVIRNPSIVGRTSDEKDSVTSVAPSDEANVPSASTTLSPSSFEPRGPIHPGNFLLCSCPGKKVRLDADPDSHRSRISRDVLIDLKRGYDLGARAVLCCLDDTELDLLGSPWPSYVAAAQQLGLSVMRMPMHEGYTPPSPRALDQCLTRLILQFTLRGKSILCHCRGGVGRAGLIACCWLFKMGFAGFQFLDTENLARTPMPNRIYVLKTLIDIIRLRRSARAIETPYQVCFLLDYISYLINDASFKNYISACDANAHSETFNGHNSEDTLPTGIPPKSQVGVSHKE